MKTNELLEEWNPKEAEVTAKTTEPKEEIELLKRIILSDNYITNNI